MATLKTYNRKLEQVLYMLGITYLSCDKDDDGMTYWTYRNDDKTKQIFDWFREANDRRWAIKW